MQHILVYGDSLSWGIVPGTRQRLAFDARWPGVMEGKLNAAGISHYRQLAVLTDADIDHLEAEVIHFSGRIRRDDWVAQAREFHARKYGEL